MAQNDGGQDREEEATPKRLREAKEKGQVARSRELTTFFMLLAGGFGLLATGGSLISTITLSMREMFIFTSTPWTDAGTLPAVLVAALIDVLWSLAPLLGIFFIVALVTPGLLGGWVFSGDAISFKWERLDPIKGIGKIFSWRGLVELIKAILKFTLIGIGALFWLWWQKDNILSLGVSSVDIAMKLSSDILIWAFILCSVPLVIIAFADSIFQMWDHARQLKMTRQEVKDENKETEGNPEVRAKIKSLQREMARRRMMEEVPKADVIITNPTHYSVALKYDKHRAGAPILVAKGADLIALQIRNVATTNKVPIISAPPLARSIFFNTELNKEVPAGLYIAVAQVLAYVYQLKNRQTGAGRSTQNFDDLPIPDDMRRDD